MPKFYEVTWHGIVPDGAATRRVIKTYQIEASSERAAVDDARDIMRDKGIERDGLPSVREIEPLEWGRASRA